MPENGGGLSLSSSSHKTLDFIVDFANDRASDIFRDIAIIAEGGEEFLLHGIIFSFQSDFVKDLLDSHEFSSTEKLRLVAAEIKASVVKAAVDFVYGRRIDNEDAFLEAQRLFRMKVSSKVKKEEEDKTDLEEDIEEEEDDETSKKQGSSKDFENASGGEDDDETSRKPRKRGSKDFDDESGGEDDDKTSKKRGSKDLDDESGGEDDDETSRKQRKRGSSKDFDPTKNHECEICGKLFVDESKMEKHMKYYCLKRKKPSSTTPAVCNECGESFVSPGALATHSRKHKNELFECEHCIGKIFRDRGSYTRHMKLYGPNHDIGGNSFECEDCDEIFKSLEERQKHRTVSTHIDADGNKITKTSKGNVVRNVLSPSCDYCGKLLANIRKKTVHMKRVHINPKPIPSITCEICGDVFAGNSAFTAHYRAHKTENYGQCDLCDGKTFKDKTSYTRHMNKFGPNHDLKAHRFECEDCNEKFNALQDRLKHRLCAHFSATGKEFVCELCGRAFSVNHDLKHHIETKHKTTRKRDLPCPNCDKLFFDKRVLKAHQKYVHIKNLIPLRCTQCSRQFDNEFKLSIHMKSVHSKKFIHCPQCSWTFQSTSGLNTHFITVHTPDTRKPFRCKLCPKGYVDKSKLKRHVNNSHSIEERNDLELIEPVP